MSLPVVPVPAEAVPDLADLGVVAFTTTRPAGSFNLASSEPAAPVVARWTDLLTSLQPGASRLATALQVHGDRILAHDGSWNGWLRDTSGADGHLTATRGTAMAVTLADCVPVFIAHPDGIAMLLHSGWKGTAAGITLRGLALLASHGADVARARLHLGPAICGQCYEVGPDVYQAVTGQAVDGPVKLDLRAEIARQARQAGATVTVSQWCTRCHNDRFFSHRAGDAGRQVAVLALLR